MLNGDVSDYYCSSTSSAGFKILLHNPTETPRISDFGMFVSPGRETRIVISPRIQAASLLIRKIPIEQRQCIFSSEANLSYFRYFFFHLKMTISLSNLFFYAAHIPEKTVKWSVLVASLKK